MRTKLYSRGLALLLALVLTMGLAPWALAADDGENNEGGGTPPTTEVSTDPQPTDGGTEPTTKPEPDPEPVAVTGVSLAPGTLELEVGKSESLTATVEPADADDQKVSWDSSDPSVASVSKGKVTAKSAGTATITVTTDDGSYTATCSVTVKESSQTAPDKVTGVSLDKSKLTLKVGDTYDFKATVTPASASDKSVKWNSSNPSVADTDFSKVTAKAVGTTTITVTTTDGNYKATCEVTVTDKNGGSFSLNKSSLSVEKGSTYSLSISPTPSTSNYTVSWSSKNTSIATVSNSGVVTGKAKGDTTVTAIITPKAGGSAIELKCSVTVTDPAVKTVSYDTGSGEPITFTASDFNSVCSNYTGYNLDYVKFTLPSSSKGTLYYDYNGRDEESISKSDKFYRSASPSLGKVSFVPASGTSGTVNITYTGWNSKGNSYTGTVSINVSKNSGSISYDATAGEALVFDSSDFNDLCKKITGRTLDYVKFDQPGSSKGVLYYNYDTSSSKKLTSSTSCYYDDDPSLDSVAFIPAEDFSGTVTISFTGRSTKKDDFSGTVKVTVGKTNATVSYSVDLNKPLTLDASDFNKLCKKETGRTLDYVKFTSLPAKTKGVLYLGYNSSKGTYDKVASKSTSYYYDDTPGLDSLTFVPAQGYRGVVSIDFTARDTNNKSFSGTLKITVGGGSSSGDLSYSVRPGGSVAFSVSDFNDYCKEETGSAMDYVKFTPPSGKGTLYYKYDESGEKKVGSSNEYVRSGSPNLGDVSFVASSGASGTVKIKFSGRSTGDKSFSGTVVVEIAAAKSPSVVRYSTGVEPVYFNSKDFEAACSARGGSAKLASIQFPDLPQRKAGRLYVNYGGPASFSGHVNTGTKYGPNGSNSIASIAFVPRAGYKGTLTIPYLGTDSTGATYTGTIEITVAPPSQSHHFHDTDRYSWAVPSVDFLFEFHISTGVSDSDYGPDRLITRGDFVLMLVRAFNLSAKDGDNFSDVPRDSYYYDAIAAAKALGVAKGVDGKFQPTAPLTRQDAMVLLQRTLQAVNRSIDATGSDSLSRFGDASSVADYARDAVDVLVRAEVIQGDESGHVNPRGSLTRAEMAVILHRVLTQ